VVIYEDVTPSSLWARGGAFASALDEGGGQSMRNTIVVFLIQWDDFVWLVARQNTMPNGGGFRNVSEGTEAFAGS
jgi:hypothetical protein